MKYDALPEMYRPKSLYAEHVSSAKYWGDATRIAAQIHKKTAGDLYWGEKSTSQPENYHYTHTLHTKARMTSGTINPRFTTKKRDVSDRVDKLEEFCRQWEKDTQFAFEYERMVDDLCAGGAVALVMQSKRKGYESMDDATAPFTPTGIRLDGRLWGCDYVGGTYESARYAWHTCIDIQSDLIAQAEANPDLWDVEAVRRMVTAPIATIREQKVGADVDRKEVTYVVMWVRGYTLPDSDPAWKRLDKSKCNGTIFKFALCYPTGFIGTIMGAVGMSSPEMLGPPHPYYGPRQGPYVYEGFLDVPNQVRKSAPLIACSGQIEDLNAQCRANAKLAQEAKTGIIVDGLSKDAVATIQDFQHGEVVTVPGFSRDRCETVQIGGPTVESLARERDLKGYVRQNLMMPDTALGEATGSATLGENEIANTALEGVTDMLDARGKRMIARIMTIVAWYAENDARTISQYDGNVMMGGRTRAEMEQSAGIALGAKMIDKGEHAQVMGELPPEDEEPLSWDDLDVTVERVKTDAQSRARFQTATEFLTVMGQQAPLFKQMNAYEGFLKFMQRASDELGVSELATIFPEEDQMPETLDQGDGQPQEPRTMDAPDQAPPRTMKPQTIKATAQKPAKQAAQLRSKSA